MLEIVEQADDGPILVLVDSDSQRMSKRDELLGLNEYLAHLAKALLLAEPQGHRTVGLLYGDSAAGAFIATALATARLVALPGAHPAVMDLPSMARVTKLLDRGAAGEGQVDAGVRAGPRQPRPDRRGTGHLGRQELAGRSVAGAARSAGRRGDQRDRLGKARKGRPKAADIAERVHDLALQSE